MKSRGSGDGNTSSRGHHHERRSADQPSPSCSRILLSLRRRSILPLVARSSSLLS